MSTEKSLAQLAAEVETLAQHVKEARVIEEQHQKDRDESVKRRWEWERQLHAAKRAFSEASDRAAGLPAPTPKKERTHW